MKGGNITKSFTTLRGNDTKYTPSTPLIAPEAPTSGNGEAPASHAYDSVAEARKQIETYLRFYNEERAHQALGYQTPKAFHEGLVPKAA